MHDLANRPIWRVECFHTSLHRKRVPGDLESLLAASGQGSGYCARRIPVKPVNLKGLSAGEVFYECLALLGVIIMTAVSALAMRVGEGQW